MSESVKIGKKDKKMLLLAAGAILGILLLLVGNLSSHREESVEQSEVSFSMDPEEYASELEAQIEELCGGVKGAGIVRATVTLKGGYRAVYATDAKSSSTGNQSSTVLVGSGSSEEAILVCYENPEIAGIGIVCEGGDSAEVRARIISLISATFSIGTNKIFVAAGE
ncbi:MAG: hypothetical protein J6Q82_01615 [Clostridia bacterium]|nr:hypothetical protein [Clostridia bacterium]